MCDTFIRGVEQYKICTIQNLAVNSTKRIGGARKRIGAPSTYGSFQICALASSAQDPFLGENGGRVGIVLT